MSENDDYTLADALRASMGLPKPSATDTPATPPATASDEIRCLFEPWADGYCRHHACPRCSRLDTPPAPAQPAETGCDCDPASWSYEMPDPCISFNHNPESKVPHECWNCGHLRECHRSAQPAEARGEVLWSGEVPAGGDSYRVVVRDDSYHGEVAAVEWESAAGWNGVSYGPQEDGPEVAMVAAHLARLVTERDAEIARLQGCINGQFEEEARLRNRVSNLLERNEQAEAALAAAREEREREVGSRALIAALLDGALDCMNGRGEARLRAAVTAARARLAGEKGGSE